LLVLCSWLDSHGSSCLEAAGFVTGVINVWLTTRENIWSWPVGILNAALYTVVFAQGGLYSDTGLQVLYLVLSIYGWYAWLHGGDGQKNETLRVSATSGRLASILAIVGVAVWLLLWFITHRIRGAALPMVDAALVSASLVAMFMQTRKLRECWLVWIAADVAYVTLFIFRGFHLTAILYFVFTLLAILGYREWNRSLALT
jgi:nicotinamide mononucleotide transporter